MKEISAAIRDVADKLDTISDLEARLAKGNKDLAAVQELVTTTQRELKDTQTGLSAQQKKNLQAYDDSIIKKQRELSDLNLRAVEAKEKLNYWTAEANSAKARHDQVEASIESLRKKIA